MFYYPERGFCSAAWPPFRRLVHFVRAVEGNQVGKGAYVSATEAGWGAARIRTATVGSTIAAVAI